MERGKLRVYFKLVIAGKTHTKKPEKSSSRVKIPTLSTRLRQKQACLVKRSTGLITKLSVPLSHYTPN